MSKVTPALGQLHYDARLALQKLNDTIRAIGKKPARWLSTATSHIAGDEFGVGDQDAVVSAKGPGSNFVGKDFLSSLDKALGQLDEYKSKKGRLRVKIDEKSRQLLDLCAEKASDNYGEPAAPRQSPSGRQSKKETDEVAIVNAMRNLVSQSDTVSTEPDMQIIVRAEQIIEQWETDSEYAQKLERPTLLIYTGESGSEEGKSALWYYAQGGIRPLKKKTSFKLAMEHPEGAMRLRLHSLLYRVNKSAAEQLTQLNKLKALLVERKSAISAMEGKTKKDIREQTMADKSHAALRKQFSKETLLELKESARRAAETSFEDDFLWVTTPAKNVLEHLPEPARAARQVRIEEAQALLKSQQLSVEEAKAGQESNKDKQPSPDALLPQPRKEREHLGYGYALTREFREQVIDRFKIASQEHIKMINSDHNIFAEKLKARQTNPVDGEIIRKEGLDFASVLLEHRKRLEEALDEVRIDKAPKPGLSRFIEASMATVQKVKGLPLLLAAVVTVLTPFYMLFDEGRRENPDPMGALTELIKEPSLIWPVCGGLSALLIYYFVTTWRTARKDYDDAVKKARDQAKKKYAKELKKCVQKAYARYQRELNQSLSAFNKSNQELRAYLSPEEPEPTKLEALKEKAERLRNYSRKLGAEAKEVDAAIKLWREALKSSESVQKNTRLFQ